MNILIIGSGGREHALAWKIKQSPLCDQLFIAPGNAGTATVGENIALGVDDFPALKNFALERKIDIIVVGPEDPLVKGIADYFETQPDWKGIVVGPSALGAQLEGSKAFSKKFMQRHHIPTAAYAEFDKSNYEEGVQYIQNHPLPIVLKADGLAAGKGVIIAESTQDALDSFRDMILNHQFGDASAKVVIEQFLSGIEISVFVLTDGRDYRIIGNAKDYKRIGEGDKGLNTGGMGCVSPVPFADKIFLGKVEERIIAPTVKGLKAENIPYKGFIFFGLINVKGDPYVIEYNCRLGDPETEVILPRLQTDLVSLFIAMEKHQLQTAALSFDLRSAATVVAVSGGYPGKYEKGKKIFLPSNTGDSIIFHAGTKLSGSDILTNGGRVLAVTSLGKSIPDAVDRSREVLEKIHFEGLHFRKDIGFEFAGSADDSKG